MDINLYTEKCVQFSWWLDRMRANKVIDLGKLSSVLHYVLKTKFNRQCVVYSVEYGAIEFTVHIIKFRLLWQPKSRTVQFICKHLEGGQFIQTGFNPLKKDSLNELFESINSAIYNVTPFDGE